VLRSPELYPNPENATLEELRVAMDAAPNKRSYVRLSALRTLLLGHERKTVCAIFDRTDRMIRLWIELFNRGGIDALMAVTVVTWCAYGSYLALRYGYGWRGRRTAYLAVAAFALVVVVRLALPATHFA